MREDTNTFLPSLPQLSPSFIGEPTTNVGFNGIILPSIYDGDHSSGTSCTVVGHPFFPKSD